MPWRNMGLLRFASYQPTGAVFDGNLASAANAAYAFRLTTAVLGALPG